MTDVFVSYNNIISSLGFDSETVAATIRQEISGLQHIDDQKMLPEPFCASMLPTEKLEKEFQNLKASHDFTRLEQMLLLSLSKVIKASHLKLDGRVGLIISTTKGNIDALDIDNPFPETRAYLSELGKTIQDFFEFKNEAIVVSNACVSGVLAIAIAKRYIQQGSYDHVFVVGGDILTPFILSGFNSFQALSDLPCKPYDQNRVGINLGELAASVLVTNDGLKLSKDAVKILGDGSCNDANHISGPSRTGEGLYRSIQAAFKEAKIQSEEIDYISAHGTATTFNDEMEAIAFNRLGLEKVPTNSLKGYFGHTLGASGLVETIVGMHSLHHNCLYKSLGFEALGVSQAINIITTTTEKELDIFLKTASGFGGCNTAVVFQKNQQPLKHA